MAAQVNESRELFTELLGEVLTVERMLADEVLPALAEQSQDPELREGFEHHIEETRGQVANVEEVFSKLGEKATEQPSKTLEALERDYRQTIQEIGPAELGDCFRTAAAAKTEHLEIAAYTSLITMARAMGEDEIVELLQENLSQEEETLRTVEQAAEKLSGQLVAGG
ncbi:MAG: DUF892 family protein [Actinomycetota bacterium]|nr:DUF892 family protein [Actinomycetota bacterium]